MNRSQLEHIIRAAATIAEDDEIIVVGSQSILGQFAEPPEEMCRSTEGGVFPKNLPERADLIDGSIGEGSPFHATFGYHAQGVDETTAVLPDDWRRRLVPLRSARTRGATGWCLEVHDLLIAKLVAGREKDLEFAAAAARHRLAERRLLEERLAETRLDERLRPVVAARIARIFADAKRV